MALHTYTAGEVLTATNLNESVNGKFALKTSTETVNNSNTVQDDDQLFITPTINATYFVQLYLIYQSTGSTPDIKFGFTMPAGASFNWTAIGVTPTDANQDSTQQSGYIRVSSTSSSTTRALGTMTGQELSAVPTGLLIMGSTAGNLQLQWSQSAAVAENTQVKANSCIVATRIA